MTDQAEYQYDVFISYSHADKEWVRGVLLPRLEEAGLKVIIDYRDFEPGQPTLVNIERAVDNSQHTLIVLTPEWVSSEWTEFESHLVGTADPAGRRGKLIPLMLKPCKLPPRINMLDYVDFTQPSEHEEQMARLLKTLGAKSPGTVAGTLSRAESSRKRRRIDAVAPTHAAVGQRIDLLVQVRDPNSPTLSIKDWPTKQKPSSIEQASEAVDIEFPTDPQTGEIRSAYLEIRIVAPDFVIEGAAQQRIEVPYDQYSKCISFLLTALRLGSCRINVEVYSVDHLYLGTIPVETTVGEVDTTPTVSIAHLFLVVMVVGQETPPADPAHQLGWFKILSLAVLAVLLITFGVIVVHNFQADRRFEYQVRVQAQDTGKEITGAEVVIEVGGKAPLHSVTDSMGIAVLFIDPSDKGQPGRLIVNAIGYERHEQNIDLTSNALPDIIQIKPTGSMATPVSPTSTFTPVAPLPTRSKTPTPTNTLTSTNTPSNTPTIAPTLTPSMTSTPVCQPGYSPPTVTLSIIPRSVKVNSTADLLVTVRDSNGVIITILTDITPTAIFGKLKDERERGHYTYFAPPFETTDTITVRVNDGNCTISNYIVVKVYP